MNTTTTNTKNTTGRTIFIDKYGYEFVIVNGEMILELYTGLWIVQQYKDSRFESKTLPKFHNQQAAQDYAQRQPWLSFRIEQI